MLRKLERPRKEPPRKKSLVNEKKHKLLTLVARKPPQKKLLRNGLRLMLVPKLQREPLTFDGKLETALQTRAGEFL